MKSEYCKQGIEKLSGLFGKTRYAYYDNLWRTQSNTLKDDLVLQMGSYTEIALHVILGRDKAVSKIIILDAFQKHSNSLATALQQHT